MTIPHKLNIKLPNGAAFEAEGTEESVRELFAQFMDIAKVATTAPPATVNPPTPERRDDGGILADGGRPATATLDRALIDRVFTQDRTGTVSLLATPRGDDAESTAMIALLYGFNLLRNEPTVSATRLMRAARQSGIQNIRLNRVIGEQRQLITESGAGKGKRYGLNNPGMRRGEEIVRGLLG